MRLAILGRAARAVKDYTEPPGVAIYSAGSTFWRGGAMTEERERVCSGCGASDDAATLERCRMCYGYFCSDCAHRGLGQRFCSDRCSMEFFYGDSGDDDD